MVFLFWFVLITLMALSTIFILYYRSKWRKNPNDIMQYMWKLLYRLAPLIFFSIYFFCITAPIVYPWTVYIVGVFYIIIVTIYLLGEYMILNKK
jgi:TRAP-type C4-dicarboxylate transport system permease large subunit